MRYKKTIDKVTDFAPNVMMARYKMRKTQKRVDDEVKAIRYARSFDNASDFNMDGSVSDAQKARFNVEMIKKRYKR